MLMGEFQLICQCSYAEIRIQDKALQDMVTGILMNSNQGVHTMSYKEAEPCVQSLEQGNEPCVQSLEQGKEPCVQSLEQGKASSIKCSVSVQMVICNGLPHRAIQNLWHNYHRVTK